MRVVTALLVYILAFGALTVQSFPAKSQENKSPFEKIISNANRLTAAGCPAGESACGSSCCLMMQKCCGGEECCSTGEDCCGFSTCCYRTETCCGDVTCCSGTCCGSKCCSSSESCCGGSCCSGTCNGTQCIVKDKHPRLGQVPDKVI